MSFVASEPLIIIDGITINQKNLKKLDPTKIIALNVIDSGRGRALYGSRATIGAIIITSTYTKKQFRKML